MATRDVDVSGTIVDENNVPVNGATVSIVDRNNFRRVAVELSSY